VTVQAHRVGRRPASEVISVRAIPFHRRGTARLARTGVLAAFLVAGPLAASGAGHCMHYAGTAKTRAQAGQARSVQVVPLQPGQAVGPQGTRRAP
jgi:hypothetical protein